MVRQRTKVFGRFYIWLAQSRCTCAAYILDAVCHGAMHPFTVIPADSTHHAAGCSEQVNTGTQQVLFVLSALLSAACCPGSMQAQHSHKLKAPASLQGLIPAGMRLSTASGREEANHDTAPYATNAGQACACEHGRHKANVKHGSAYPSQVSQALQLVAGVTAVPNS